MGMSVDLEEREWNAVISAIAAQHPLIVKISSQLIQQKAVEHAEESARAGPHQESQYREKAAPMAAHQGVGGGAGLFNGTGDSDGERRFEAPSEPWASKR